MEDQKGILLSIKNPLSIIALFVILIEGVVSATLCSKVLTENQRSWLILFCIIFPVIVLVFFFIVVWYKPQNLFGPLDYDDSKLYLKSLMKMKINDEVKEIENESKPESGPGSKSVPEVSEKNNRKELMLKILAAEDLAFNNLQLEFGNNNIKRHILGPSDDRLFDGVIRLSNKERMAVEVKYFNNDTSGLLMNRRFERFLNSSITYDKRLVAIVTDRPLSEVTKDDFCKLISVLKPQVQARFYSFNS